MKKSNLVLGAATVAALGIAGAAASHVDAATVGVVQATTGLNVRSGAGTSYSKIGTLYAGAKATALGSSNGWTKINYNGKTGYVSSTYLKNIAGSSTSNSNSVSSSSTSATGTYSTTAGLNVRSGAGTSYSKIGTLTKGSLVKVLSCSSNGWTKINYNGKTGYVSSSYLVKSNSGAGTSNITTSTANKSGLITKSNLLVINQNTMTISLYKNGIKTNSFACATGKAGGRTPTGVWSITNKIVNRPYYKGGIAGGDPKNPLGNRWMQLSCGSAYGIHGTCYPWSMGSFASEGCVRMTNSTIEYLYDKVPVGTTVIISNIGGSYSNKDIAASKGIYVNY